MGRLLFWSSTLAQCQTHSSAVGVGVDPKMLLLAGCEGGTLFLLPFIYKGREKFWSCLTGEYGNRSFLLFSSELLLSLPLLGTSQSSSQLKWMRVVVWFSAGQ